MAFHLPVARLPFLLLALGGLLAGCDCKPHVATVKPTLGVTPTALDFGKVKKGRSAPLALKLEAQTNAAVTLSSLTLESGGAPGGAEGFSIGEAPKQIDALGNATVTITFSPSAFAAYEAALVIASNDEDRPQIRVPLLGEGTKAIVEVTPECGAARNCVGSVTVSPPAIDFGAEPFLRLLPIDVSRLPAVVVVNAGPVPLDFTSATFEGADPAAFTLEGSLPDGGLTLGLSEGRNLPIRFKPTSEAQQSYHAQLVIGTDDADRPRIPVELSGTLRPNLPPVVCANLTGTRPPANSLDPPRDYSQPADWSALLVPPPGGYDFSARRDVRPGDTALFSALSDVNDVTRCSSDPEDGRAGLTWRWALVSAPPGAQNLALAGATTPLAQLRTQVTGEYVLSLTVADAQGHATSVQLKYTVALKQDFVAQLQWPTFNAVDLDLHLVRPSAATNAADPFSGAFDPFDPTTKTSGDINGYTAKTALPQLAGANFDWGQPGAADDPRLNLDNTGNTADLLENISLNSPEDDARCAAAACTYKVMVHYFRDDRVLAGAACVVDGGVGCGDGQPCSCGAGSACVARVLPVGDAGVGAGECRPAPKPVVRLFFRGSATPATVIPLDTLVPPDDLVLGAPCQMLYVADVDWPAKNAPALPDGGLPPPVVRVKGADGTGRVTTPAMARYGYRRPADQSCTNDDTTGPVGWYTRQP